MKRTMAFQVVNALGLAVTVASSTFAQSISWTSRWDGGIVDSDVDHVSVAVGAGGERFAVASVYNGVSRRDLLTMAWSGAGELLWSRLRDFGGDEKPEHLEVDASGRILVLASSDQALDRLVTLAYDLSGVELWANAESDPLLRRLEARGLAIDAEGTVVAVAAAGTATLSKSRLFAYDTSGLPLWDREYSILPAFDAVAFDSLGHLALAGRSPTPPAANDFLTVLFDSEGNEVWSRFHDSEAQSVDTLTALAIDSADRIVVTGLSAGHPGLGRQVLTVCYDSVGDVAWAVASGGANDETPGKLRLDPDDAIYISGAVETPLEDHAFVLALESSGEERWLSVRADPPGVTSTSYALVLSSDGGVVSAGQQFVVGSFAPLAFRLDADTGLEDWSLSDPVEGYLGGLAASDAGAVFAGGIQGPALRRDLLAWSVDGASGSLDWRRTEPKIRPADRPGSDMSTVSHRAIAMDFLGRAVLTGASFDGTVPIAATVAFDAAGNKVWEARKRNSLDFSFLPSAVAASFIDGNIYLVGTAYGPSGPSMVTIAYDAFGFELWSRTRRGPEGGYGSSCCVAVAPDGRVVAAGEFEHSLYGIVSMAVSYDASGNELWSDFVGSEGGGGNRVHDLVVDSSGNSFLAGDSFNGPDFLTWAIDGAGVRQWTKLHGFENGDQDSATAMDLSPTGGVVVSGHSGLLSSDLMTVAYDVDGNVLWSHVLDGGRDGPEGASAVAMDEFGRAYIVGATWGPDFADSDFLTAAYDAAGQLLWKRTLDGGFGLDDLALAASVDAFGSLVVTGSSDNGLDDDLLSATYSPGGFQLFEHRYDHGGEDRGYISLEAGEGRTFIGGSSEGLSEDFVLIALENDSLLFADGFESGSVSAWSDPAP